jgi:Rrf2 family iron-responsive transcriptional regulator
VLAAGELHAQRPCTARVGRRPAELRLAVAHDHLGVRLGRAADKITLFDVVRVTEDSFSMAECFDDGAADCPLVDSCGLNSALRKALNAFFEVLEQYTIDDLVKARPQIHFLLGLEEPTAKSAA